MGTHLTYVTRKGQVTIPQQFRAAVGLESGDRVEWSLVNGAIQLRPVGDVVERLSGRFRAYGEVNRGKSIEQILSEENAAVDQAMSEDWERTLERR